MRKFIAQILAKWIGLTIVYPVPLPAKCVVCVVPHTSNWDFPLGLIVRASIGEEINFVGKSSLFRWPLGVLFRWLGGHPVDRSKSNNFVDEVAALFERLSEFRLTIAPEGTRTKVDKLKTGFYYISLKARVPIVLCAFDWGKRTVRFSEPFSPTGDLEADFTYIHAFFKGAKGINARNSFDPQP